MAGAAVMALVAADEPGKPPKASGNEAAEVAQALEEAWPDHPEWVDMLTAILQDEPMSATYGWFRTAVAQTRFDWDSTRKRYDRDGDGKIARAEFPGGDADFARFDRDRDKSLTAADFDFSSERTGPLARRDRVFAARSRRQRQDHARRDRRILRGDRQRQPGFSLALRPARGVHAPAGDDRRRPRAVHRRPRWSAASSARRSARFSPGPSSTSPRLTLP